jgi:hypothetical protein
MRRARLATDPDLVAPNAPAAQDGETLCNARPDMMGRGVEKHIVSLLATSDVQQD